MSQSLSKVYVHIVFHVKYNSVRIRKQDRPALYAYMGTVINSNASIPIIINGVDDHVHILCIQSKNIALAKLVEEIKRHSSRWIKTVDEFYARFAWQKGYGAFSVSESVHYVTKRYILNQEAHHNKTSTKKEYVGLLQKNRVDYDDRYLLED